jgi:23S rRNA (adenine2503-C2)-methyltransferase
MATRRAHVNLIPYNPVASLSFDRPDPEAVSRFVAILRNQGVSVTVRKTKGRAIDAACGQLRRRLAPATTVLEPQAQPPDARSLVVS